VRIGSGSPAADEYWLGRIWVACPRAIACDKVAPSESHLCVNIKLFEEIGCIRVNHSYSIGKPGLDKWQEATVFTAELMCQEAAKVRQFRRLATSKSLLRLPEPFCEHSRPEAKIH
jgi:hypothetical protein